MILDHGFKQSQMAGGQCKFSRHLSWEQLELAKKIESFSPKFFQGPTYTYLHDLWLNMMQESGHFDREVFF